MRKCRFCDLPIAAAATVCPHCAKDLIPGRAPAVGPPSAPADVWTPDPPAIDAAIVRVSVVDIDMPFGSMVGFMVKWALAAIPALLILGVIAFMLMGLIVAIGGTR